MTLEFRCTEREATSPAAYLNLLGQIDDAAAESIRVAQSSRTGPFGVWNLARGPKVQALAIARAGLFDADYYCSTYKDVVAVRADPLRHYIRHGDAEGRWPNPFFDPAFYRDQFSRLGQWPFSALYHYAIVGEAAGLRPCAAFDRARYVAANPGLGAWLTQPLAHYLWIGRHHGLSLSRRPPLAANQRVRIEPRRPAPPVSASNSRRAVNFIGPLDRVAGLGVSARGYLEAAELTGFGPVGARVQSREFGLQSRTEAALAFPNFQKDAAINLVHLNGDSLPSMLRGGGRSLLAGRYNIAIWYWELPTLRPEWWVLMDEFHAFWAPTPFIAKAIRQFTSKPVHIIPPYLSYLSKTEIRRPPPPDRPHFIYCFDANSIVERKNPSLLLAAFLKAFPNGSTARLTFKLTYPNRQLPEIEQLYAAAQDHPSIVIQDRLLADGELHRLVASATAYVSPHRSEGLGLTMLEAMAFGTPVIGTPFGGIEPFMTPDAAWPLTFRLAELDKDHGPYPRGFVWADPDLESLVKALKMVVADPAGARARAAIAQARVLNDLSSPALIHTYLDALDEAAKLAGL